MRYRSANFHKKAVALVALALVPLFAPTMSDSAGQVPSDLLGVWSNSDKTCKLDASPDEAFIYTITPKYISYYEIDCLIQDVNPTGDKAQINLDCFKGGGIRYFDKLTVQRLPSRKLSLRFSSQRDPDVVRLCTKEIPKPAPNIGTKITRWTHNGSIVSFQEDGGTLEIDYEVPRPSVVAVGVRPGTMLFLGTRTAQQIEGKAYIFNRRCGPLGYEVHGEVLDAGKLVMLTGLAPKVSAQCAVVGRIPDTLRFEQLP
jgi:hypothetical protein